MGAFEFSLSFYGLLLGLSVAEVASGLLNAVGARHRVRLGRLTQLLAVFVFLDITSFWIYFWGIREHVAVNWLTMFGGLVVALTYYLSAGLVFPRNISEWPDLDEHYRINKRLGIKLKVVAYKQGEYEKVNVAFASGDLPRSRSKRANVPWQ